MKINIQKSLEFKNKLFSELELLECFIYEGNIYIKVEHGINAIALSEEKPQMCAFALNTVITPIDSKLTIYPDRPE